MAGLEAEQNRSRGQFAVHYTERTSKTNLFERPTVRSADSEVAVLLLLWVQVEGREEPLAHDESLAGLDFDLVSSQRLQKDECDGSVEAKHLVPDGNKSGTHSVSEVALSNVEKVGRGVADGSE